MEPSNVLIGAEAPDVFPAHLLDEAAHRRPSSGLESGPGSGRDDGPLALDRRWLALYTKSRQEKALARRLAASAIPFYLPLIVRSSFCRGRRLRRLAPVFSNYVFLFADGDERLRALQTNRISRVLEVADQERLFFDLRQLQRLIASDAPLTIESRLTPGRRVRVRSGALAGLEGTILQRRGRTRLIISVNCLQQGASVDIDDFQVESID